MIKFKRLTIALAALFIASATAWAQTVQVKEFTVPSTWEGDENAVTVADAKVAPGEYRLEEQA